jgi:sodium/proline symporter
MSNMGWTIIVFLCYMAGMILIGASFFKKADTLSDYFIGGRRLNPWVAALSAHATDMSGWLFMGFPGVVYAYGTGQVWIALGLVLGTVISWSLIATRLRRYTISFSYSITIPEFFENRFQDSSHILRIVSSVFIIFFFTIYTASGFIACGILFSQLFAIDYQIALIITVLVILSYTFLGGFRALCWSDFFQGLLMLVTVVLIPVIALFLMGGLPKETLSPNFLNIFLDEFQRPLPAVSIISGLAWGLGYLGMPHILVRFMAIKNERAVSKAAVVASLSVLLSLTAAAVMGIAGRFFVPALINTDTVYIRTIQKIFMQISSPLAIPGSIFLCGIFAAIISTTDSQLLVTVSAITSDIYQGIINKEATDKHLLLFSRFSVAAVSLIAYIIATDRFSGIMRLVSQAWAGFGSAFGALILLSLYWKRLNRPGAAAGIISGGLTVIIWDYLPLIPSDGAGVNLGQATGLYSLAPGFCISLLFIILISLLTKAPSRQIYDEFEIAAVAPILEE